ncbi:E3 ubiquitin-protein ligase PUB22-like [Cynara cardunculus var. scolymus]|uniref:E3 ubiquitin-protein ligase PUB22-like n=1 Tax=Cynara cardunculus var. scolymus TaxID=59895 RepID=UPI000D62EC77|nr:E3 ubiquitin-protein ligase PUB22-like [Cynara cardunculus var. scolymus]
MGDRVVEVPTFFLCPISLEIMKDPVTLSTGITYDRDSIEKWLFSQKSDVCPVTKQVVVDIELTPNHTLRRFIQSWCTLNASLGVERFPTPRIPISKTQILKLLKDSKSPKLQINSLKRLKTIVMESEKNKRLMESAGAADYLASMISRNVNNINVTSSSPAAEVSGVDGIDEALSILYHLKLSPSGLKSLLTGDFVETLTSVMQHATSFESRTYAVMLLKSMFEVAEEPMKVTLLSSRLFEELVRILVDQISQKATKATLKLLINVCPWGRNRIKGAEAGAVPVLIDTLLDCTEKRVPEMAIIVLDHLCQCAEGRADLLKHGGGLAVVSKKIFRVSPLASERAVRILYSVAMFSGNSHVLQEMVQLGVVGKLFLVLQVDCGSNMKEKAREILKMHARVWKKSSCIPNDLISVYPS